MADFADFKEHALGEGNRPTSRLYLGSAHSFAGYGGVAGSGNGYFLLKGRAG
jgi:hypothetical protein